MVPLFLKGRASHDPHMDNLLGRMTTPLSPGVVDYVQVSPKADLTRDDVRLTSIYGMQIATIDLTFVATISTATQRWFTDDVIVRLGKLPVDVEHTPLIAEAISEIVHLRSLVKQQSA